MRAVNLIPADERRRVGGSGSGVVSYIILAVLALVVAAGAAHTLANRSALQAYTAFTALRQKRSDTVRSLATSRFDWSHALHEVARTLPSDAWVTAMRATVTPTTAVEGGVTDPLRAAVQSPAIEILGCTTSQNKIAGVISSLRRADGVERVSLSASEKLDTSGEAAGGSDGDCRQGNSRFPKFSLTLFLTAPTQNANQGTTP
jgi:hypothetical protein